MHPSAGKPGPTHFAGRPRCAAGTGRRPAVKGRGAKAAGAAGRRPVLRILCMLCLCAGLAMAARPAAAGIEPTPFLNFNFVDASSPPSFQVSLPSTPVVPVEILSLSLTSTSPAVDVMLAGSDSAAAGGPAAGQMGMVAFSQGGTGTPPADGTPVAFELLMDVAPYMGSSPVLGVTPDPFLPGSSFDVMFDVFIDGGVVHHMASFTAASGFMFSNAMVAPGSVDVGFDLTGPYTGGGPALFSVTITGSATPVPEPATLGLFLLGLAGLGFAGRRRGA